MRSCQVPLNIVNGKKSGTATQTNRFSSIDYALNTEVIDIGRSG